jgi:hypothetical protein
VPHLNISCEHLTGFYEHDNDDGCIPTQARDYTSRIGYEPMLEASMSLFGKKI